MNQIDLISASATLNRDMGCRRTLDGVIDTIEGEFERFTGATKDHHVVARRSDERRDAGGHIQGVRQPHVVRRRLADDAYQDLVPGGDHRVRPPAGRGEQVLLGVVQRDGRRTGADDRSSGSSGSATRRAREG